MLKRRGSNLPLSVNDPNLDVRNESGIGDKDAGGERVNVGILLDELPVPDSPEEDFLLLVAAFNRVVPEQ